MEHFTFSPNIGVLGIRDTEKEVLSFFKENFEVDTFYEMHQIHSADVLDLRKGWKEFREVASSGLPYPDSFQADAIVVNWQMHAGEVFVVKTADCLPIIVANGNNFTLIHAGWKGLASGIVSNALRAMKFSSADETYVYIGPHAGCERYEVGRDVVDLFDTPVCNEISADKFLLDMEETLRNELYSFGIDKSQIASANICTISNDAYYSYRRDKEEKKRNLMYLFVV